jgi:hypothetical protein
MPAHRGVGSFFKSRDPIGHGCHSLHPLEIEVA